MIRALRTAVGACRAQFARSPGFWWLVSMAAAGLVGEALAGLTADWVLR